MNERMCASIISLRRLKPRNRSDVRRSFLSSSASPSLRSVCTFTHTIIRRRWLLLFVVVQYDLKELQIKSSVDVSVSVSPVFF